jgi:hypothetical protein
MATTFPAASSHLHPVAMSIIHPAQTRFTIDIRGGIQYLYASNVHAAMLRRDLVPTVWALLVTSSSVICTCGPSGPSIWHVQ